MTPLPDEHGTRSADAPVSTDDEPTTGRKLRFLQSPASYPEATEDVRSIETHFAWVFLTDEYAWKLKKPMRAQAVDYRRLEDREYYCREELRLNRRLAAWVYLDVVALTVTADGAFELGGDGRAADWLVKMVRLPEAEMMDNLIRSGRFGEAECERIAGHLARFYAGLTPERLTPEAYVSRLLAEADEQQRHFAGIDDAIATQPWQAALDDQRRYIRTRPGPIGERAAAGRIVEAHGDLRPQHVYLGSRFAVIDCLEFSRDLRIQDSAEEIAFLALECQRVGDRELRDLLLEVWQATSGDPPDASLLSFYLSRRAIVRAILSAWHLDDPHFDRQHYIEETEHYVGLARQFIREALSAAER